MNKLKILTVTVLIFATCMILEILYSLQHRSSKMMVKVSHSFDFNNNTTVFSNYGNTNYKIKDDVGEILGGISKQVNVAMYKTNISQLNFTTKEQPLNPDYIQEVDKYLLDPYKKVTIPMLPSYQNPCWYSALDENVTTMYNDNRFRLVALNHLQNKGKFLKFLLPFREKVLIPKYRSKPEGAVQIKCLPKLYILGIAKSGTTDLYFELVNHPQIFKGRYKEYHWWNKGRVGYRLKEYGDIIRLKDYIEAFDIASHNIEKKCPGVNTQNQYNPCITLDASPSTLWNSVIYAENDQAQQIIPDPEFMIPAFMHKLQPDAKLMVILRNPTNRLYSDYHFFKAYDKFGRRQPELFHKEVIKSLELFKNCKKEKSERECVYNIHLQRKMKARIMLGMYSVFLKDWLSSYESKQLLVLKTEEYASKKKEVLRTITDFLSLNPYPKKIISSFKSSKPKNTSGNKDTGAMLPETKQILDEFYQPFNDELADILGDEKFRWLL